MREPLPTRRPCVTEDTTYGAVTVSFHPKTGAPVEVFITKRLKSGTQMEAEQYEIGVTASLLMQDFGA